MKKTILIVDDDPNVTKLLRMVFIKNNYEVIIAEDGESAIEKACKESPDLILSDVTMPGIDGFEFYSRLQKNAGTACIPLIFLSGQKGAEEQLKGLRMGAVEYLIKPFDLKVLRAKVEDILAKIEKQKFDFGGNLETMNFEDIIQILEINLKTGELMFTIHGDQHIGSIFFKEGKIIYAVTGTLEGEEALYELLSKDQGYTSFYSKEIDMPVKISGSSMGLLLEVARIQDEAKALYDIIDRTDVIFQINSKRIDPKLVAQLGRDFTTKILIMIDQKKTLEMILKSGMMSRCRAEYILAELINAGLLEIEK